MPNKEKITLGGGCFWCMEAVFQMLRGVESVMSGYTGGAMPNPTYEQVCGGATGHAEAVKVEFDPSIIRLNDLLAVFFTTHDPTTPNRQGHDIGTQYRSAIFYSSEEQKKTINAFIEKLNEEKTFSAPIVTQVEPASIFYPAEQYHQNYYANNPEQAYCQAVINPKLGKLRKSYAHLLKTEK